MQASDLLVAAADRIRDLAAAATPPPWEIEYDYAGTDPQALFRMDPEHPDDPDRSFDMGGMIYGADNAWVAALSPAVAPHLEAWLRWAAKSVQVTVEDMGWPANGHEAAALRLALLICPELAEARVQCSGAVHNLSLSAPERCALEEGHEGTCEP